jgi:hypothetical protein
VNMLFDKAACPLATMCARQGVHFLNGTRHTGQAYFPPGDCFNPTFASTGAWLAPASIPSTAGARERYSTPGTLEKAAMEEEAPELEGAFGLALGRPRPLGVGFEPLVLAVWGGRSPLAGSS